MKVSIAVIPPIGPADVLADTVLDGLMSLSQSDPEVAWVIPGEYDYQTSLDLRAFTKGSAEFKTFSQTADVIFFLYGKRQTNTALAEEIGLWDKTVYIDGSEVGGNRRYDFNVQRDVVRGAYGSHGKVDGEMLGRCALYFKREKPYVDGVLPLPFGIETRSIKHYIPDLTKDIDFFCVFGQDEFPLMRRYAKELVKDFCDKNNFSYEIETTQGFTFDPRKKNGRDDFYTKLARAKVGISIGGGGFDTGRFWEILGNNCLLITERIDIYEPDSKRLSYDRIFQCNNLYDIEYYLKKVGKMLNENYNSNELIPEWKEILKAHSSQARVMEILSYCKEKQLIG